MSETSRSSVVKEQSLTQPDARQSVTHTLMTEEAIYGLILVSGMILLSGLHEDTSLKPHWSQFRAHDQFR